jgi:DNA-binding MarR family transcriptional regulator
MYDVMATLRRIGLPHEWSPSELVRRTMITTGAMTNRIDHLEQRGYVERVQSTQDQRSVTVWLTASGGRKVDAIATSHYELESQLLDAPAATHQRTLGRLLRTMLISLGDTDRFHVM